jgi:hypothetical protein
MKTHLLKLKAELKVLAHEIRELKKTRKQCSNGYVYGLSTKQEEFRTKHIARCILRGRTIEQIEPKLREPDNYRHQWVRKQAMEIVAKITEEVAREQTVCVNS